MVKDAHGVSFLHHYLVGIQTLISYCNSLNGHLDAVAIGIAVVALPHIVKLFTMACSESGVKRCVILGSRTHTYILTHIMHAYIHINIYYIHACTVISIHPLICALIWNSSNCRVCQPLMALLCRTDCSCAGFGAISPCHSVTMG